MTSTPFVDLTEFNELKNHIEYFVLWPEKWQTYSPIHIWNTCKLDITNMSNIPPTSGIYSLILDPNITGHPSCLYLFYVGRTINLRDRFYDYLTWERKVRPKISVFLARYDGYIHFCHTPVSESQLISTEIGISNAYIPPLNERYEGEISPIVRAFP